MLVVIRGAGDIATGIALRLWRAHIQVVMTDIARPTAIRRTVCFSQAIVRGETAVEDVRARRAASPRLVTKPISMRRAGQMLCLVTAKACVER